LSARGRDAERSRQALLDAGEALFAARGYDAVTMAEVGAAAGLSRGAPGYFFGSKDELYGAVLQRVFAARTAALEPAFAPLVAWARGEDARSLEAVLAVAVDGYVGFLRARPAFVALSQREAVAGGARLASTPHESPVVEHALRTLRRRARERGLRAFDVQQALIAFVSLCFFPLATRDTLLRTIGADPDSARFDRAHRRQVVGVMLALLKE
jgi:TetR/AcrR family transcriptional regulator